jgi:lipoprotein NlpI
MRPCQLLALIGVTAASLAPGPAPDAAALVRQAEAAMRAGDGEKALELAGRAIEAQPADPRGWNYRGALHFRLARIEESIADFNRAISLDPDHEPHHWQRGISYYYAGEYEKGARQFEIHQTVNRHDVENAVWHFLCVTRWKGLDEAQRQLIPIEGDGRVPMMQVHALFAGRATPEQVLTAAQADEPPPRELHHRLFYAHLYLGLYHEAHGRADQSLEHMSLAVERFAQPHYMGDVARVHLQLRGAAPQENNPLPKQG